MRTFTTIKAFTESRVVFYPLTLEKTLKKKPPKEKSIHAARKHGAILIGESSQDSI
jgi:hypothetical protein